MTCKYLITFRNKKGEILSQSIFAKSQLNALQKASLEDLDILAITKLEKNLGDKL